jgi:hypothetical protein
VTIDSLRTELAAATHRNRELCDRVQALERRLSAEGASVGPSVIDQHPVVLELRVRLGRLEAQLVGKNRAIESLEDNVETRRDSSFNVLSPFVIRVAMCG